MERVDIDKVTIKLSSIIHSYDIPEEISEWGESPVSLYENYNIFVSNELYKHFKNNILR